MQRRLHAPFIIAVNGMSSRSLLLLQMRIGCTATQGLVDLQILAMIETDTAFGLESRRHDGLGGTEQAGDVVSRRTTYFVHALL